MQHSAVVLCGAGRCQCHGLFSAYHSLHDGTASVHLAFASPLCRVHSRFARCTCGSGALAALSGWWCVPPASGVQRRSAVRSVELPQCAEQRETSFLSVLTRV